MFILLLFLNTPPWLLLLLSLSSSCSSSSSSCSPCRRPLTQTLCPSSCSFSSTSLPFSPFSCPCALPPHHSSRLRDVHPSPLSQHSSLAPPPHLSPCYAPIYFSPLDECEPSL